MTVFRRRNPDSRRYGIATASEEHQESPPPEHPQDEQPSQEPDHWVAIDPIRIDGIRSVRLSERQARLWALVLESRYFKCEVVPGEWGWQVLVPSKDLEAAQQELRQFVEENRFWPPPPPVEQPMLNNTLAAVCVLFLLATFHNVTQLDISIHGRGNIDWIDVGNAHASLILHGEWWRIITALTLHADWLHLISNLAFGGIFVVYLCRDLGGGLAWSLLLASGALGNLANAYFQLPSHTSVGSSTAVFGAVGILGAMNLVRYRHHLQRRWPMPIAAALSLLALMGTEGKNTDLGAHLFGFAFGVTLGLVSEFLIARYGRPGRVANAVLSLLSAGVVVFSWWEAVNVS